MFRLRSLLALVLVWSLSGCDAFEAGPRVEGRVVDSATGEPISVGSVFVNVYGQEGFLSAAPLIAEGEASADGAFSFSDLEETPSRVSFGASARINYPGRDSTGAPAGLDVFRYAYFPLRTVARSDFGTVELHPTCTALGDVTLSRPLLADERIEFRLASVPDAGDMGPSQLLYFGGEPLDSLRLLGVGGREARLEWTVRRSQQEAGVASGAVSLPVCPRHGVLEYTATLDLG